jgi:hypothetical protein
MKNQTSLDSRTRYTKNSIPKELWLAARADALHKDQTIIQWLVDAIKARLGQ